MPSVSGLRQSVWALHVGGNFVLLPMLLLDLHKQSTSS